MIDAVSLPSATMGAYPGYVHMPFSQFRQLGFAQRMAFDDADLMDELAVQGPALLQAGYCDWVDNTVSAQVCVGWAWCLRFGDAQARLAPGGFSSNVMFLDAHARPLGPHKTQTMLRAWLATKPWQATLHARPNLHYGHFMERIH